MLMAAEPKLELERLVEAHQRGVWRYLRFLGAGESEADDLTQETFLEVWRKPFEQQTPQATAAYLRCVAKNRFLMFIRARGRRPAVIDLEQAEHDFAQFARDDGGDSQVDALTDCMGRLDGRARQAVDLFYRDGHSRQQAAQLMHMKEEGFKTLLRRVKELLRECMERRSQT
ncbi:MAG: sigma-70 family RNA polymerase sigma factor [Planctomycetota bacterium]|nr:MAG: sigma-70 family RNA polymerase sigma factor [Planctomycetota bacterium]